VTVQKSAQVLSPAAARLPSLRERVMRHVLWPLALAWLLVLVVSALVATVFIERAFDGALLDDALAIAQNVEADGPGGNLQLSLSPQELGTVLFDQVEQVYYAVLLPDGRLLAGQPGLDATALEPGKSTRFVDIEFRGQTLRAVTLRANAGGKGDTHPFLVVLAETTRTRIALLRSVLLFSLLPQVVLLLFLAGWLQRSIAHDMQPLAALERAVDARDVHDLSPVAPDASVREVQRLGDAVNNLFGRVSEGMRAQREFAGNVAHELRTPLAGIRSLAEYGLAQADDPALWREQLRRIVQSEARASHLVEQLLALARADEVHGRVALEPVALDALVREAVLRFLPSADALGVDLGAHGIDEAAPVWVQGQPALLEGIVNNLIDNSLRYALAPAGSARVVTVAVRMERAAGSGYDRDVYLSVMDNGPGIDPVRRQELQQRWAQGAAGAQLGQGAGLGLAIVARYADLMGADFSLQAASDLSDAERGIAKADGTLGTPIGQHFHGLVARLRLQQSPEFVRHQKP
jgi:two-component system sensor histidine kinase TctE